jgi:hypothetical protein
VKEEMKFGGIEFSGKDIAIPNTPFDRIAISGRGELLLVSLVAPTQTIKQIRAILHTGNRVNIVAGGIKVKQPIGEPYTAHQPGNLHPSADGYTTHVHKLDYGQAHALMITKASGFIKIVTDETIWQELTDPRFTTPVLRDWVPHISQEMREREILEEAHVFNCNCGIMSATTQDLDEIVSEGLRAGAIYIPTSSAA